MFLHFLLLLTHSSTANNFLHVLVTELGSIFLATFHFVGVQEGGFDDPLPRLQPYPLYSNWPALYHLFSQVKKPLHITIQYNLVKEDFKAPKQFPISRCSRYKREENIFVLVTLIGNLSPKGKGWIQKAEQYEGNCGTHWFLHQLWIRFSTQTFPVLLGASPRALCSSCSGLVFRVMSKGQGKLAWKITHKSINSRIS